MFSKVSYIALAVGLMSLHQVKAEWGDASFELWDGADCGTDPSTAFKESSSSPFKVDPDDTDSCSRAYISADAWGNEAYINPSFLKDGCRLVFFGPPPGDETQDYNCDTGTHTASIQGGSGCRKIQLSNQLVYSQCCGKVCDKYKPKNEKTKREVSRDVTAIKRAPILANKKRDGECKFVKTGEAVPKFKVTRKTGQTVKCAAGKNDCEVTGSYEATTGVSHSVADTTTVSFGFSGGNPFYQVSANFGLEKTVTEETNQSKAFTQSYSLFISAGTTGYLTFKAKMSCGKGHFEGAGCVSTLTSGGEEWCVPAFTKASDGSTIPDGMWSTFVEY